MLAEATTANRSDVLAAIRQASAATGSDFQYLLDTATRESNLRPDAKAGSSSAVGLFQFTQQTWLGMIRQHGAEHGLGSYAKAIHQDCDGRYHVDDKADREAILGLRNDPKISALMAGEYANETRSTLQSNLGRNVCGGELYAAHFLGPDAACRLIRLTGSKPDANAAAAFPDAASANRNVFYRRDGTAKTVREVYNWALQQPGGSTSLLQASAKRPSVDMSPRDGSSIPSGYLAYELMDPGFAGLGALAALPGGPFALTPGVVHILANLSPDSTNRDDNQ